MVKAVVLLCVLAFANARYNLGSTSEEVLAFSKGFVQGVEANPAVPSQCGKDLAIALETSSTLVADIKDVLDGVQGAFTKLVVDFQSSSQNFAPIESDCNFSALEIQLKNLLSPNGVNTLFTNYFRNIQAISESVQELDDCSSDYFTCGQSAGTVFRLLVGWTLNGSLHLEYSGITTSDYVQMIKGIVKGLEAGQATQCSADLNVLITNSDDLVTDIENIINGVSGSIVKFVNDFDSYTREFPDLYTLCNLEGLVNEIANLMGPNGFMQVFTKYMQNQETITGDLAMVKDCASDYYMCGESLGEVVTLLLGWSI